jgi:hypothetical protein
MHVKKMRHPKKAADPKAGGDVSNRGSYKLLFRETKDAVASDDAVIGHAYIDQRKCGRDPLRDLLVGVGLIICATWM